MNTNGIDYQAPALREGDLREEAEGRLRAIIRLEEEARQIVQRLRQVSQEIVPRMPWRYRWLHWLKLLAGVQVGILQLYPPRPLALPAPYQPNSPLADPPRIALVTPSFNQGRFLKATLRSVLDQHYPRLEYVVQDGGSADETPGILAEYGPRLTHCTSAPDRGQAHAINLGFAHTRGEIMAYLNSDDLLLPGALSYVAEFFARHPEVDVVYGNRILIDAVGNELGRWVMPAHDNEVLSWADYVPQETLFWRRRIWDRVGGGLDESFQFAMDWDLLLRFRDAGARFARLPRFLGAFRVHSTQKTTHSMVDRGAEEMSQLRQRCHGRKVSLLEIRRAILPYLCRQAVSNWLYRLRGRPL